MGGAESHHVQVASKQNGRSRWHVNLASSRHGVALKRHVFVSLTLALLLIGQSTTALQMRGREQRRHAKRILRADDRWKAAVNVWVRRCDGPRGGHHQIVVVLDHVPCRARKPRLEKAFHVGSGDVVDLAESDDVGGQSCHHAPHGGGGRILVHAAIHVPPHGAELRAWCA